MTGSLAMNLLSYGCIGIGLWFWLWGTWPLLGERSVLYKLHSLSVADTLGSMLIVVGLLMQIPREWPLLLLALISLAIWNTVLGYVLAYCSQVESPARRRTDLLSQSQRLNSAPVPEVRHDG